MRLNYETCLVGSKCVLVPYRPCHVAKYHEWMKDPHLLEMTGSEPLSLEEEIAMQLSWRDDDQKCTFIVLSKELCNFDDEDNDNMNFCQRNLHAMVGDVNLFFSEEEEEAEEDECITPENVTSDPIPLQAELDIMIAESRHRGKGIGKEASCLMMLYGAKFKQIRRFFCKIKENNDASLNLFRKSLGFHQCAYAACFQEYELELKEETNEAMIQNLQAMLGEQFEWKQFTCRDNLESSSKES